MRLLIVLATLLLAACAPRASTPTESAAPPPRAAALAPAPLVPDAPLTGVQRAWVDSTLATLSLRERVGQMVMVWVLGDYTNVRDSSFAEVLRWIERDGIGGVSMSLGTPIEVAAKINAMQRRAKVPLIASSDLEPGLGRLEGGVFTHYLMDAGSATVFPSAMAIAATGRDEDAREVARVTAREARAVGIQINFAPVVDVNNNPSNPVINTRSFGEDPARVARLSSLFVRGTQEGGALATAKHFPGHGDTDVDSHVGLPIVAATRARLDSVELVPFKAAIAADVGMVMTAHIALPAVTGDSAPATLEPRVIHDLLRGQLHFGGTTITDAMTMEGVGKGYSVDESSVLAIKAGSDILLKPSDPTRAIDAIVAAVERGEIPRARIDSAARRVLELKARTGVAFHPMVSLERLREVVGAPEHRALAEDVARRAITLLRDRDSLVPLRAGARIALVEYMPETELRAGRIVSSALGAAFPGTRVASLSPATSQADLDSLARRLEGVDRVVVAAYVRRIEGAGRPAMPQHIARWVDALAARQRTIVVAFGNPYLIGQFPKVGSYLVTYGVGDALERAAVGGLLGRAPITGKTPVSLPGFFARGDGLVRSVSAMGR
jgi:beta-N-acetylhexosaminidase